MGIELPVLCLLLYSQFISALSQCCPNSSHSVSFFWTAYILPKMQKKLSNLMLSILKTCLLLLTYFTGRCNWELVPDSCVMTLGYTGGSFATGEAIGFTEETPGKVCQMNQFHQFPGGFRCFPKTKSYGWSCCFFLICSFPMVVKIRGEG